MKLVFEVEIQTYGEDAETERDYLNTICETLIAVVNLTEMSVGNFTTSRIEES